ncbi:MAG TPA: hypothetical protein VHO91_18990, partial [Rhodopila sp.]|nr:hypothetical protein [Rhodopila sp.]
VLCAEVTNDAQPGNRGELQQTSSRGMRVMRQDVEAAFLPRDRQQNEGVSASLSFRSKKGMNDFRGNFAILLRRIRSR